MILSGTAVAQVAPLPSPAATIALAEIQAHLHPDEILIVFQLDEPSSSRWVISREHAVFDPIAGRQAIDSASPEKLAALLFRDISTAEGRPMLVVAEPSLQKRMQTAEVTLSARRPVTFRDSVEALVQMRSAAADSLSSQLGWVAATASLAAAIITFRRILASA